MPTYQCIKHVKTHTGKSFKVGDTIDQTKYNNLSFSERQCFNIVLSRVEGMEGDFANEL